MTKDADKRRGFARREFIACRDRLHKLLEEGHTVASAHDELIAQGVVSMKYRTFAQYVKKYEQKTEQLPKTIFTPSHPLPVRQETTRKPHKASIERLGVDKNEIESLLTPVK